MSDIEIRGLKLRQPIICQCGRKAASGDASTTLEGIEIACSGCGQSILEIEIEVYAEAEPW